jgi:replicative DNA helicase
MQYQKSMIEQNSDLPYNKQAERDVISAILFDITGDGYSIASAIVVYQDFFVEAHRQIFFHMGSLATRSLHIDITTLVDELTKSNKLDSAGGASYVAGFMDANYFGISLIAQHATIIKEKSTLRAILNAANEVYALCKNPNTKTIDDILYLSQKALLSVSHTANSEPHHIGQAVASYFSSSALKKDKEGFTGCPTSFPSLDRLTSGLQGSDLIILAARPSIGKTALSLNIARNAALRGKAVGFFSLEMSSFQCVTRLLSTHVGITASLVRDKSCMGYDTDLLVTRSPSLCELKLWIDDTPNASINELVNTVRKLANAKALNLVIIDYLQLIRTDGRFESKNVEISIITKTLKSLARELNIPIIVLSQLSRALELRAEKRPQLSDLRDSGSIEQDADLVIFLYRPNVYNQEEDKHKAELIIAKHRNGDIGNIALYWDRDYISFTEEGE